MRTPRAIAGSLLAIAAGAGVGLALGGGAGAAIGGVVMAVFSLPALWVIASNLTEAAFFADYAKGRALIREGERR